MLLAAGEREDNKAKIEEALSIFRETLTVRTRESGATDAWADSQANVAQALEALGNLNEALAALREAATERSLDRTPDAWIGLQNQIGSLLSKLGKGGDPDRTNEAIGVFRGALKESSSRGFNFSTAILQRNLADTLQELENDSAATEEAISLNREALKEFTRVNYPNYWASTQHRIGTALLALSVEQHGTSRAWEAVNAFSEALKERTRERDPEGWAQSTKGLGLALVNLGYERRDVNMINRGTETMRSAGGKSLMRQ
jgi:tetratricopeptide (TPR) repeat protein